jgi:NADPH:quinone reductase
MTLDGPSGVRVHDIGPPPQPDSGQVLVDVAAVGLSFADLLMAEGKYQVQPDLPFVLGIDFSGVVRTPSPEAGLSSGDRVVGWSQYGSAAEVVAVAVERVLPLPATLSFEEGAAMPLNYLTAHFALVTRAGARAGDTVLVNGAAGGLGSAAIQVANGIGCRTIGVVSSSAKAAFALESGADDAVIGTSSSVLRDMTHGRGVDVVLDVVGSEEVIVESLRSLATGGRLLSLGYVAGHIPSVRLNRLLLNNIDVRGVSWGPYTREHPDHPREQWRDIERFVRNGPVRPQVRQVHRLSDIAAAMTAMRQRRTLGKTVLTVT